MFTGLVETVGTISQSTGSSPRRLTVRSTLPVAELKLGDSVAIDGCCLTVVEIGEGQLSFEAATETLAVTSLGRLNVGSKVNLERAMRLGDRLGGHLVLGHVDGVGKVAERKQDGSALYLGIDAPKDVAPFVAKRGSVTVSGVSLTVTDVRGARFFVGLIPHTLAHTNLDALRIGDEVNLEADVVARYLARMLEAGLPPGAAAKRSRGPFLD